MLKLYNTLTRKKEVFKPIKKEFTGLYTCGPTVYNYAHIGNLRTYIFEDILKRVLSYNKYKVKHVMNITDVGHLTSDSDEGEDKMILAMRREGKSVYEIAEFYTKAFKNDIKKLNILEPDIWCKATEHIKEMINLIKKLEKKNFTYISGGNIYYDISKFKNYGKLARLKLEKLDSGSRVAIDVNKKNPQDFVLWFTKSKFGESHEMIWNSPWNEGFPGWHVECSAMSMKYLGEHFDIHCGGIDHIPVHHTNEIAQSEGATGKKWVNYWLHGEFLILDKKKMAKSGEYFITLETLEKKGFDPLAYRYFCLNARYRSPLNFSWEALENAKSSLDHLNERVLEVKGNLKQSKGSIKKYKDKFLQKINDDLNLPEALAILWDVIKDSGLGNKEKYSLILDFDKILGLNFKKLKKEKLEKEIEGLIEKREEARKNKDYKKSDEIRAILQKKGIILEDTLEGIKWRKA